MSPASCIACTFKAWWNSRKRGRKSQPLSSWNKFQVHVFPNQMLNECKLSLVTSDQISSLNALLWGWDIFSFSAPLLSVGNQPDQVLFWQRLRMRINNQQHQSKSLFRKTKNCGIIPQFCQMNVFSPSAESAPHPLAYHTGDLALPFLWAPQVVSTVCILLSL